MQGNGHDKATAPYVGAYNEAMADSKVAQSKRETLETTRRSTDDPEMVRRLNADLFEAMGQGAEARQHFALAEGRLRAAQAGHAEPEIEMAARLHALGQYAPQETVYLAEELMLRGFSPVEAMAWALAHFINAKAQDESSGTA